MTWVKICGITNLGDAQAAAEAGADALGFVFYENSPRRVTPETVRRILAELPPSTEKVGVFVYRLNENAALIADQSGVSSIQIHLHTLDSDPSAAGPPLIAAALGRKRLFPALPAAWVLAGGQRLSSFIENRPDRPYDTIFLDSGTLKQPGGTGMVFDWEKAVPAANAMRAAGLNLVVAGGLTPANVSEAMRILKPWGVDVSSGVEASPGKKDPKKVRAFIAAVRHADRD